MNIERRVRSGWSARLACAATAFVVGCTEPNLPGMPRPENRPVSPDQILSFESLYRRNCAGCHGANGELGPAPPLNDPLFLAILPDAELARVVHDGRKGTPMPAFAQSAGGSLTDGQVRVLVTGIRARWGDEAKPKETLPGYELTRAEGVQSTPGSRERGEEVFGRACAGCHGANGDGVERDGKIASAINVPAFLALISDQALRRIIITGRPDLGMPTYAESDERPADFQPLTPAEIDDLVALLADWRVTSSTVSSSSSPRQ